MYTLKLFFHTNNQSFRELKPREDYHFIVEEYAEQGWRLVQILTPPTGMLGSATHYDIIYNYGYIGSDLCGNVFL